MLVTFGVLAVAVVLAAMHQPLTDFAAVITATSALVFAIARASRRR